MIEGNKRLAERCVEVAGLSKQAFGWINDPANAELVGFRKHDLSTALRKNARRAEKLGRSAKTKMSVSVFGPSQAGKSFLVSILARPDNGRLVGDFNGPDCKLDYISQVNPAGDGESTGLVTRFTMDKADTPEGFPIQLNLMSEADIACMIINSFFEDGDQSEPVPDGRELQEHIDKITKKQRSKEFGGLDLEDVYEIQEYVEGTFGKTAYAVALKGLWDDAARIAPKLPIAERAELLSIAWGGHKALTDLYTKLANALASVKHAKVIYAPRDALVPREKSIIDVQTLSGLFETDRQEKLEVETDQGTRARLDRAEITALAVELVFPMQEQPSEFFAETDLLDFPGARNRFEQPLSVTLEKPEEMVSNLLLRGKVAYLFDRYVANQEITSMLLCIPDSNMETVSLPGLVERWIEMTHGPTPAARVGSQCILFFVLTKFDKHLIDTASGAEDFDRFERRMEASLKKGFGKVSTSWVYNWTTNQPFQNCFWLRNPYYMIDGLIRYENQVEVEIHSNKIDRVAEIKTGYMQAPAVQEHFKDPERAWDAALALNDGGVSYLVEELTQVCKPENKIQQINTQILEVAHGIHRIIGQFYVSDDIEKLVEEKKELASKVRGSLRKMRDEQFFGAFLYAIAVDSDVAQERMSRLPSHIKIIGSRADGDDPFNIHEKIDSDIWDDVVDSTSDGTIDETLLQTIEEFQVDTAIQVWVEGLNQLCNDKKRVSQVFKLDPAIAADMVSELTSGLERIGVRERIIQQLESIKFTQTLEASAPAAAMVCAENINQFVFSLGIAKGYEFKSKGRKSVLFPPQPGADKTDDLPEEPRNVAQQNCFDWSLALEVLLIDNAKSGESGALNIEQNMRLGGILKSLEA